MGRGVRVAIISFMLAALLALVPSAVLADSAVTIDFEGLAEGAIVSSLSVGSGISGDPVAGTILVHGTNPDLGAANAARIFDATCAGSAATCTGGDDDLFNPAQGNVLIIDEDLVGAPDDADVANAHFDFDFSGFGPGSVTVESIFVQDLGDDGPAGGEVQLYADAAMTVLIATVPLPVLTDGASTTVAIGVAGVVAMRVVLGDSGSIDDIKLTIPDEPGVEGCTPGYWKQDQHLDSWVATGFSPNQTVESVFDVPDALGLDNDTLLTALDYSGGSGTTGASRILLRAAVAALLNSSHPDVDYPRTTADVIADVNAALASNNRSTMLALATELDLDNNLGCSLS